MTKKNPPETEAAWAPAATTTTTETPTKMQQVDVRPGAFPDVPVTVEEDPAQARVFPQDPSTVTDGAVPAPEGRYHGYSPLQIKVMEESRATKEEMGLPTVEDIAAYEAKQRDEAQAKEAAAEEARQTNAPRTARR